MVVETFQDLAPDLLHKTVRKFGSLDCSNSGDKLYGLIGILDERTRASVEPDYTRGVSHAYYQTLKIGYQELYREDGSLLLPERCEKLTGPYLGYYCDARDAFRMADRESVAILPQVLGEIRSHVDRQHALTDVIVGAQ
jgi:hypothetical protein